MADIRKFIQSHLLEPLKSYPTVIQDTMIEIISEKLEELYTYTVLFPEIVSPNYNRLDILKAIASQFLFTVRGEADLQEQIDILDHILYVYNRRGSIDTIENMWKYYGGNLPKELQVIIPSYKLFRYSISELSGTHVFQDNNTNRTGVYEVRLVNNTYPIPDLKEFMLRELVAAGNYIYFTNTLHMNIVGENTNHYKYNVLEDTLLNLQMTILRSQQGFIWSGYNPLSKNTEDSAWSGRGAIYIDTVNILDLGVIALNTYGIETEGIHLELYHSLIIRYSITMRNRYENHITTLLYCTPSHPALWIARYLYNRQGELITSNYPGYFVLGETLLGKEVI